MRWAAVLTLFAAVTLALLLGVVSSSVRVDGLPGVAVAFAAGALLGAAVAYRWRRSHAWIIGTLAGASAVPIVLAWKVMRWPDAPLLGDGAPLLLAGYVLAVLLGAIAGSLTRRRVREPDI